VAVCHDPSLFYHCAKQTSVVSVFIYIGDGHYAGVLNSQ